VEDTARRAVAEHLGWLRSQGDGATVVALGRLFSAARAALLWESLEAGDPILPVTIAPVAELLDGRLSTGGQAKEALASYRAARLDGVPAPARHPDVLRDLVMRLPGYEAAT
jgi:hypothetical protein